MIKKHIKLGLIGILFLCGCYPPPQPQDEVRRKSEENLKQMYNTKIELLQAENDRLQAKVEELAETVRNLEVELRLARERAKAAPSTNPANTGKETSRPKEQVTCRILAFNERLNVLIVSAGKDKGLVQGGEYNIYSNSKLFGRLKIDKLEQDWASGSVLSGQDINQLKASDVEIVLTP